MKNSMFLVRFALIVGKLKVGRPLTAKELADYVNSDNRINGAGKVSVRTIQRDIAELRDGLGMNIVNKKNNTYAIEPMKEYCPEHIKNFIEVIYEILKGFEKTEPEKLVLNTAINQSKDVKISLLTEENKCIDIDKAVTLKAEISTTLNNDLIESLAKCSSFIKIDKPDWMKKHFRA